MSEKGKKNCITIPTDWKDAFKTHTLRVGFQLSLTRAMLEFLCAVADDVVWDRWFCGSTNVCPDNWIATELALTKRGLIYRDEKKIEEKLSERWEHMDQIRSCASLTPAGELVVQLLKLTGLFIDQDAAISRRSKKSSA